MAGIEPASTDSRNPWPTNGPHPDNHHKSGRQESNLRSRASKARDHSTWSTSRYVFAPTRMTVRCIQIVPAAGVEPAPPRLQRSALPVELHRERNLKSPSAGGGSRTHNNPLKRRTLYHLSYTSSLLILTPERKVPGAGIEPTLPRSERGVLPLNRTPECPRTSTGRRIRTFM
jgi:hypothetical protein